MKTTISNNITVTDYNLAILNYCQENLVVNNPQYYLALKMGRYVGNIEKQLTLYEKRGNEIILPFGTIRIR